MINSGQAAQGIVLIVNGCAVVISVGGAVAGQIMDKTIGSGVRRFLADQPVMVVIGIPGRMGFRIGNRFRL